MRVLIIGCGYVGMPLGRRLSQRGHAVFGLRRGHEGDAEMQQNGIVPLHSDITDPDALRRIEPNFDAVVNLVSSSKGGVEEYRRVYLEGARNILAWLGKAPARFYIYTSSTSVYAQTDGSWVTEESAVEPDSATSRILAETEHEVLGQQIAPASVLRVSGIYGPGRGHLFKQFRRGEATMRDDGSHWINMVHVEDVAGAIAHLLACGAKSGIYNVSDDEPVTQREFFGWLAKQLGRSMPPGAPADPQRKRGVTNKRVANAKIRSTGFNFRYPTFRDGYAPEVARWNSMG